MDSDDGNCSTMGKEIETIFKNAPKRISDDSRGFPDVCVSETDESECSFTDFSTPLTKNNTGRFGFNCNASLIPKEINPSLTAVSASDNSDPSILEDSLDNSMICSPNPEVTFSAKRIMKTVLNSITSSVKKAHKSGLTTEGTPVNNFSSFSNQIKGYPASDRMSTESVNEEEISKDHCGVKRRLSLISNKSNMSSPESMHYNFRKTRRTGKENTYELSKLIPKLLGTPMKSDDKKSFAKRKAAIMNSTEKKSPLGNPLKKSRNYRKKIVDKNVSFREEDISSIVDNVMTLRVGADESYTTKHKSVKKNASKQVVCDDQYVSFEENPPENNPFVTPRRLYFRKPQNNSLDDSFGVNQESSLCNTVNFTPQSKSRYKGLGDLLNDFSTLEKKTHRTLNFSGNKVHADSNAKEELSKLSREHRASTNNDPKSSEENSVNGEKDTLFNVSDLLACDESNVSVPPKTAQQKLSPSVDPTASFLKRESSSNLENDNLLCENADDNTHKNSLFQGPSYENEVLDESRPSLNDSDVIIVRKKKKNRILDETNSELDYLSDGSEHFDICESQNSKYSFKSDSLSKSDNYIETKLEPKSRSMSRNISGDVSMEVCEEQVTNDLPRQSSISVDDCFHFNFSSVETCGDDNYPNSNRMNRETVTDNKYKESSKPSYSKEISECCDNFFSNEDIGSVEITDNSSDRGNGSTHKHEAKDDTSVVDCVVLSDDDEDFNNIVRNKTPKRKNKLNLSNEGGRNTSEDWDTKCIPHDVPTRRKGVDNKYDPDLLIIGDHESSDFSDVEITEYGPDDVVEISSESSDEDEKSPSIASYIRSNIPSGNVTLDHSFAQSKKRVVHDVPIPSHSSSPEHTSFLLSLNNEVPLDMCHPDAVRYRDSFPKYKDVLVDLLFKYFNQEVFKNKLPAIHIKWSGRLTTTSGITKSTSRITPSGKIRTSGIKLSKSIVDNASKLRDVLLHEMCHAANWLIDEQAGGHGPLFREWVDRAWARFPELPRVTVCHRYEIKWKYTYKCNFCGYEFGKMRLSLKDYACGLCGGHVSVV